MSPADVTAVIFATVGLNSMATLFPALPDRISRCCGHCRTVQADINIIRCVLILRQTRTHSLRQQSPRAMSRRQLPVICKVTSHQRLARVRNRRQLVVPLILRIRWFNNQVAQ